MKHGIFYLQFVRWWDQDDYWTKGRFNPCMVRLFGVAFRDKFVNCISFQIVSFPDGFYHKFFQLVWNSRVLDLVERITPLIVSLIKVWGRLQKRGRYWYLSLISLMLTNLILWFSWLFNCVCLSICFMISYISYVKTLFSGYPLLAWYCVFESMFKKSFKIGSRLVWDGLAQLDAESIAASVWIIDFGKSRLSLEESVSWVDQVLHEHHLGLTWFTLAELVSQISWTSSQVWNWSTRFGASFVFLNYDLHIICVCATNLNYCVTVAENL